MIKMMRRYGEDKGWKRNSFLNRFRGQLQHLVNYFQEASTVPKSNYFRRCLVLEVYLTASLSFLRFTANRDLSLKAGIRKKKLLS